MNNFTINGVRFEKLDEAKSQKVKGKRSFVVTVEPDEENGKLSLFLNGKECAYLEVQEAIGDNGKTYGGYLVFNIVKTKFTDKTYHDSVMVVD